MSKRALDRIDTRGASSPAGARFAVAHLAAVVVACSLGAPATQSGSNVAEFSTIPGGGSASANQPPAPSLGSAGSGGRVDAVTGATSAAHRTHVVSWDCTDHQGQRVPDGSYRVYFEVTEANAAGPNHFETFEKGSTAVTLQASVTNFEGIELVFQP